MKTPLISAASIVLSLFTSSPVARADASADWNSVLVSTQKASGQNKFDQARSANLVGTAIFATVHGLIEQFYPARPAEYAPPGANLDAAVAQAAASTLQALFPDQAQALNAQLDTSLLALTGNAQEIADGRAWGEHVAQTILAEFPKDAPLESATFRSTL